MCYARDIQVFENSETDLKPTQDQHGLTLIRDNDPRGRLAADVRLMPVRRKIARNRPIHDYDTEWRRIEARLAGSDWSASDG